MMAEKQLDKFMSLWHEFIGDGNGIYNVQLVAKYFYEKGLENEQTN